MRFDQETCVSNPPRRPRKVLVWPLALMLFLAWSVVLPTPTRAQPGKVCRSAPGSDIPGLCAFKTDAQVTDLDGDGLVDAGDRVRYAVELIQVVFTEDQPGTYTSEVDPSSRFLVGSVTTTLGMIVEGNNPGDTRIVVTAPLSATPVVVTYDVEVIDPVPASVDELVCQGLLDVSSIGSSLSDDPDLPGDADPTRTPIDFDPDLALAKSDGDASVSPGEEVSYELSFENLSDRQGAAGVVLEEIVPTHTSFDAASSSPGWSCSPSGAAGSTCTLFIGAVGPSASGSRTFGVRLDDPVPAGVEQITNTAVITDDGSQGPDPDPSNNTASDTTPVDGAQPDLTLSKDDRDIPFPAGSVIVYFLDYANVGNQGASGVVIEETVPHFTRFEAGASSPGWICATGLPGDTCTLDLGDLAGGGAGGQVLFAVRVDLPLPAGAASTINRAVIRDDGTNGPDPTPVNNQALDPTTLVGAPDLRVTKDDRGVSVEPGELLVYQLLYANVGTRGASGVVVADTIPLGTTFDASASTPGWICSPDPNAGSVCTFDLLTVEVGDSGALELVVRVDSAVPPQLTEILNEASISDDESNGLDPNPTNNVSTETTPIVGAVLDLVIAKDDGGVTTSPGRTVAYRLDYANVGNRAATGVEIEETVPAHTRFDAVASTDGWVCGGGGAAGETCVLSLGTVSGGASGVEVFAVAVDDFVPPGLTEILNQADIVDDGTNGPDADPTNNRGADRTPLTDGSGTPLRAFKTDALIVDLDGNAQAGPGEILQYIVDLTVEAGATAEGAIFTTETDPHTTLIVGSVATSQGVVLEGNQPGDTRVAVDLGDLTAVAPAMIAFDVRIDEELPPDLEELLCQGELEATHQASTLTDDPDTLLPLDPTATPIRIGGVVPEIPTLGFAGLLLLSVLIAWGGWRVVGLREAAPR